MSVARRTLLLIVILLAAVLPAAHPAAGRARQEAITIGMTDLPTSLDPAGAYDFAAWEVLSHLYTGLTRQVPGTVDYELALVSDYTVSDDSLTYTFTLIPDAAFSDGTPITAQTFVESINRVLSLRRDALQAVEPYVARVEANESGKLVFTLVRPVPFFLALLSLPPYFPQHPALAAADTVQSFAQGGLIGNGPYRLESFDLHDEIVLHADPAYALGPQPLTPAIILRGFDRSQDLRDAVRDHAVDIAWRSLLLGHIAQIDGTEGLNWIEVPGTRVYYLYFGQQREPTDDPLVREALTRLLDRQSAVDRVFGGHLSPLTSLIPPEFAAAYAPIWPDEQDIATAETVLRQAGYRDRTGWRVEFFVSFSQPTYGDPYAAGVAQLVRSSYSVTRFLDPGVFTDIERQSFFDLLQQGDANVAVFAWTPIVPDPYAYLYPLAYSTERLPRGARTTDPAIDALLDEAAVTPDAQARGALYQEVAGLLLESFALAPLWQDHLHLLAWDDIGGIQIEPNGLLHYDLLVRE